LNTYKKEFETIALAALFHDIGKVLNRTKDGSGENHTELTKSFLDELVSRCENIKKFVNVDIFSKIASHHHEGASNLLKPKELSDEREKFLATIISRADNFSSSERAEDEDAIQSNRIQSRMRSIFYNLKFDSEEENKEDGFYEIKDLKPENAFFKRKNQLDIDKETTQILYKDIAKKITDEIMMVEAKGNFDLFFSAVLHILEKYLALIPSNTQFDKQDISLFDHLSTTSAIAVAYYNYLEENQINNISELDKLEKDERVKPFILLQGDVSGIQNFILKIEGSNPRGLVKTLRGRSFYVSALSRAASLKLVSEFKVVQSNIFLDAGGKFSVLLPNISKAKDKIKEIRRELDEFFFSKFAGLLNLNLTDPVEMGVKDFAVGEGESNAGFLGIYNKLGYKNQIAKSHKFFDLLSDSNLTDKFLDTLYTDLNKNGVCDLCGTFPRKEKEDKCSLCLTMEKIGQNVIKDEFWILYSKDNKDSFDEVVKGVYLTVVSRDKDLEERLSDALAVDRFFEVEKDSLIIGARRWINNHLPLGRDFAIDVNSDEPKDDTTLCYFCTDRCKLDPDNDEVSRKNIKNGTLTFQCIATYSRFLASKEQNKKTGEDYLGVLKADVDNLGKLFRDSMRDKFSISRLVTVSRFINYFFTEVLQRILKEDENEKFKSIYTVYSGGDDLFLIGPWLVLPDFALHLSKKFREFTGRECITFSCGIEMFRPKFPIGRAVEIVDDSLELSKRIKDKGNITIFRNTVKLFKKSSGESDFEELLKYRDRLFELCKKNTKEEGEGLINKAFIYRILNSYRPMFLEAYGLEEQAGIIRKTDNVKILSYRYIPLLKRDIARNVVKDRKDRNIIDKKLSNIYELMEPSGKGKFFMQNFRIPAFLTLYKLRGGE
jgi:CRISPR-associated protein Csm1